MSNNPFIDGSPVPPEQFFNRHDPISRIVSRIVNHGQSSAVIGEAHIGKTSLLTYLHAPEKRKELFGARAETLVFSFLDSYGLFDVPDVASFWERALLPLQNMLEAADVLQQLGRCQASGYTFPSVEAFLQKLRQAGYRLVLLVDEFDALLYHPKLNNATFFGGLRSLASLSQGALVVVIASRLSVARLNQDTQTFNPTGSPFFNYFAEITLSTFSDDDCQRILAQASERFSRDDCRYIRRLAGAHPYLLQATASAMWDAYDGGVADESARYRYVFERLYKEYDRHFADTWRVWSPAFRQAFTSVALVNAKAVLGERSFDINTILEGLSGLGPELRDLTHLGLVEKTDGQPGGWRIAHEIMLAWLTDELMRSVREEVDFEDWLRKSEMQGRWTVGQREQLKETAISLRNYSAELFKYFVMGAGGNVGG